MAKFLDVTYRTVENWAAQGFVKRNKSKYGLISALQHRNNQLIDQLSTHKDNLDMGELKLQKLQADVDTQRAIARIKTVEALREESKVVDAEEVGAAWKNYVLRCRAKLLSLPNKLALELAGIDNEAQIKQILQKTIDEALAELTNIETAEKKVKTVENHTIS